MRKIIQWVAVILIAIIVLALIFGGGEEQTPNSTEKATGNTENTIDNTESITDNAEDTTNSIETNADSADVEQTEPSEGEGGVSVSTKDLLKAYEDNEVKENRVQKEHAQSHWRGNSD